MAKRNDSSDVGGLVKNRHQGKSGRDEAGRPRQEHRGRGRPEPQDIPAAEPPVERKDTMKQTTATPAPQTTTPVTAPKATTHTRLASAAGPMKAAIGPEQLAHPNDSLAMKEVLKLAVMPPMKVDGKDNPDFRPARDALRQAISVADSQDLGRKLNLFAQRTISGVAAPAETSALFGISTAQGRRWLAHDVLAVQKAVAAIKTSRPALVSLFTETFVAQTMEGVQVRNLARQVPNTTYVSYAYGRDALPAYLKVLKANGLTDAAAELERHIGESNMRAVLAQQRKTAAKDAEGK